MAFSRVIESDGRMIMTRSWTRRVWAFMILAAVVVRLVNVFVSPELAVYDGFGHFTYIWRLSEHQGVPLASSGWSFFHPPLYYWLMAQMWNVSTGLDARLRLKAGMALIALLGMTTVWVLGAVLRYDRVQQPVVRALSVGVLLFIPVQLYSSGFLGNESLNAVLCAWAFLATIWVIDQPTHVRAASLGILLGLAMLTKFTGLVAVVSSFGTLVFYAFSRRRIRTGFQTGAVVVVAMLAVCGSYYARNIGVYGTPFKMSRDYLLVRLVESSQPQAERSLAEYLAFDPMIFRRPSWPTGPSDTDGPRSRLRNSVWTGVYANTWFDGFGGAVLPKVTDSERARRCGQILMLLGIVPTLLTILGSLESVRRIWRGEHTPVRVASTLAIATLLVIFVCGTRRVPAVAAIKATYFLPIVVPLCFSFALGLERATRWNARCLAMSTVLCVLMCVASVAVFTNGLMFDSRRLFEGTSLMDASVTNLYGVLYYAAGDRHAAEQHFVRTAASGYHLGYENLAHLAAGEGNVGEAIALLRKAEALQPQQAPGTPQDRDRFTRLRQAEYENSISVLESRRGEMEAAERSVRRALALHPRFTEAHYNLAVIMLRAIPDGERWSDSMSVVREARRHLRRARLASPTFQAANRLSAMLSAALGDCPAAKAFLEESESPVSGDLDQRLVEIPDGANFTASLARRMIITPAPERPGAREPHGDCPGIGLSPAGNAWSLPG